MKINDSLKNQIQYRLDKIKDIDIKDLENIESILIEGYDIDLKILKLLKNLKEIEFRNVCFSEEDFKYINDLKYLKSLSFISCSFDTLSINSIEELKICSSDINSYEFLLNINNLKVLTLVNLEGISLDIINRLDLVYLNISNSIMDNNIIKLSNIEELDISLSNIDLNNIDFNICNKLNKLIIDDNIFNSNKDLINNLNINIYDLNMCLYKEG